MDIAAQVSGLKKYLCSFLANAEGRFQCQSDNPFARYSRE
jgi:hypothetical protein